MRNIENYQIFTTLAVSNRNYIVWFSYFEVEKKKIAIKIFLKKSFMPELLKTKIGWSILQIWQNRIQSELSSVCYCMQSVLWIE